MKQPTSIFIEGRSWFDKQAGNSYFSCRVWVDGKVEFTTPMEYGYGDHFQTDAINKMVKRGYLPEGCDSPRAIRELGIHFYSVNSFGLKRELFKARLYE